MPRWSAIAAIALIAAGAIVAVLVLTADSDDRPHADRSGELLEGPGQAFSLRYPEGWDRLDAAELRAGDEPAVAGVRRADRKAIVTVQQGGRLEQRYRALAKALTRRLERSVKDFRFVNASTVDLPAGSALSYTFVRRGQGQIQNLTVVPRGDRTWTLSSVVAGNSAEAARQVAAIVRSFQIEGRSAASG